MPRLDVLLARNTGLSRKQVKRLLRAGRLRDAAGQRLDDAALALPPTALPRDVLLDDAPVKLHHRFSLALNKPLGVVTAQRDARHETAYACLHDAPLYRELRGVGRLDKDTSGLLLWTTDGTLLHKLTHPRYGLPRTYHAGLARPFIAPPPDFELDDGHRPVLTTLTRESADAMHPALRRSPNATHFASITIRTGRFHEVRRIFAALQSEVVDLCRVAYGGITLPTDQAAGEWRALDLHAQFRGLSPRVAPAP
ncbi:MAG: rRNA pseudouridine synthase [Nannocystaceae bacterium]|nr:rRNA pseudouridine synthase [Nannocystaceae bacterium]